MRNKYRLMKFEDYPLLIKLWKDTPGIGVTSSDREEKIKQFLKKNNKTCFVALDDITIIGTVLCGNDCRRGYIYHLVVKDEYRKNGIATKLIDLCFQGMQQFKIEKCHLFVFKTNVDAIDYYIKTKWQRRDDLVVFTKNL